MPGSVSLSLIPIYCSIANLTLSFPSAFLFFLVYEVLHQFKQRSETIFYISKLINISMLILPGFAFKCFILNP